MYTHSQSRQKRLNRMNIQDFKTTSNRCAKAISGHLGCVRVWSVEGEECKKEDTRLWKHWKHSTGGWETDRLQGWRLGHQLKGQRKKIHTGRSEGQYLASNFEHTRHHSNEKRRPNQQTISQFDPDFHLIINDFCRKIGKLINWSGHLSKPNRQNYLEMVDKQV